jgi:hypothetical protein
MKRLALLIAMTAALGAASSARADLVIAVQDATMAESASQVAVNVLIYSTTGNDTLANYQYVLQVSPAAGNADSGAMEFSASLSVYNFSSKYIFASDGTTFTAGQPFGTTRNGANPPNDQFLTTDSTSDSSGNYINVPIGTSANPGLLATVVLTPETGTNAPHAGDKFDISLQASDPFTTFQYDPVPNDGNPSNLQNVPFSGTTGVLSIVAATPTPEPGSMALFGCGGLLLAGYAWRRRRGA